jgi:hypothetical protein
VPFRDIKHGLCQATDEKKRKGGVALVEILEPLQFDKGGALKKTVAYQASVVGIVIGKRIELLKGMKTTGGAVKKHSKGMLTAFNDATGDLVVDFGDGVGVEIPLFCVQRCADEEKEAPAQIASAGSQKKIVPADTSSSANAEQTATPASKKCRLHGIIADVHFLAR